MGLDLHPLRHVQALRHAKTLWRIGRRRWLHGRGLHCRSGSVNVGSPSPHGGDNVKSKYVRPRVQKPVHGHSDVRGGVCVGRGEHMKQVGSKALNKGSANILDNGIDQIKQRQLCGRGRLDNALLQNRHDSVRVVEVLLGDAGERVDKVLGIKSEAAEKLVIFERGRVLVERDAGKIDGWGLGRVERGVRRRGDARHGEGLGGRGGKVGAGHDAGSERHGRDARGGGEGRGVCGKLMEHDGATQVGGTSWGGGEAVVVWKVWERRGGWG